MVSRSKSDIVKFPKYANVERYQLFSREVIATARLLSNVG